MSSDAAIGDEALRLPGDDATPGEAALMEAVDVDHRCLPYQARLQVLLFLNPYSSIPQQLDAWLRQWSAGRGSGDELQPQPVFVPPSEVATDVRDLSALVKEILQLTSSEIDFCKLVGGLTESDAPLDNANWQSWATRLCGEALPSEDQAIATGVLARGFLEQNGRRVTNFFCSLPQLCQQATRISFNIQKYDIYVAKRDDTKLRNGCPQLLLTVRAAQKVASAYNRRAMAGFRDLCAAMTSGLEAGDQSQETVDGGSPAPPAVVAEEEAAEAAASNAAPSNAGWGGEV